MGTPATARKQHASDKQLLIFDADDTLWITAPLYEQVRDECKSCVESCGLDPAQWYERQVQLDSELVPKIGVFASFPTACAEAYRQLAKEGGKTVDEAVAQKLADIANSVYERPVPIMPGVEWALRRLAVAYRLTLLTKGEEVTQQRRVNASGLRFFFERVKVVDEKSPAVFSEICRVAGVAPSRAWSIGNSLPSDVNTALRAGLNAIWIPQQTWAYEEREKKAAAGKMVIARRITQVPAIVARETATQTSGGDLGLAS